MKRSLPGLLLMLAGNLILNAWIAWWAPVPWIVLVAFYFRMGIKYGAFAGGTSLSIAWMCMAFILYFQDHADVLGKTALILGGLHVVWLFLITFLISFVTGALSGWTGGALEAFFRKRIITGSKSDANLN